ncbi:MAG: toprim domain-containing protein [Archaeoglobaceae archaeon]|nr:toprim domain-containing protein [Archaeoglobaceae archaeon]MCX8151582.1 toprim domain-containing protein [Archaeoglobaceae archaeon]MDW8013140.1 toprim domain-containing protein [Archaeoglobaceae archaeon]
MEKLIEEMKSRDEDGWIVVVEGIKDFEVLKDLGIKNVYIFNGYRRAFSDLFGKKVVVLTDYDEKGIEIAKKLKEVLNADVEIMKRIFSLIKKDATKVEELKHFLEK